MNAKMIDGDLKFEAKYDTRKPSEFGRWIKDAIDSPEFKQHQRKNPVLANFKTQPVNAPPTHQPPPPQKKSSDVCSMRIISRP